MRRAAPGPLWPILSGLLLLVACASSSRSASRPPNIVVLLVDDLGYADIGPFGGRIPTPHLDRMAQQGMRCTDFQVSSAVCSASRAALLTGCLHPRVGIHGALGPDAQIGLHDDETTLAELCRSRGYATACFGKWHLGHHPRFLPPRHGFDHFYGLPYSNDMWPQHPAYVDLPPDAAGRKRGYPDLPLLEGERIAKEAVTAEDQARFTRQCVDRAIAFVEQNRDRPFLLYVPFAAVHVPLFAHPDFAGSSGHGVFGDVLQEIDAAVGAILAVLQRLGLDEQTLVLFTSDNGPWLSYGDHAGSAGPLREGKGTAFEGGTRVPAIVRWPGRVPAGSVCGELMATIDVLPTVARLITAELPARRIDGHDVSRLWCGEPGAVSPHEGFPYYYGNGQLQAVRDRRFKLQLPHPYATLAGKPGGSGGRPAAYTNARIGLSLFDLAADPGEQHDVSERFPEAVARLSSFADRMRKDLGDSLTGVEGTGVRAPGRLEPGDARLR